MVHMAAMYIVCVVDSMVMWSVWCIFRLYGLCGAHGGYVVCVVHSVTIIWSVLCTWRLCSLCGA